MSGSVRLCWRCQQYTWDRRECVHCGTPETPEGSVCVCCGGTDELELMAVDVPTNYQPVCEGCLDNYRKNCEPGE